MAKVDVLIPTFNRGVMLREAVQSILKQTMQDFRIIIWDDGSTDGSTEKEALPDDPRIIVLNRGGENKGIAYARNQLLKQVEAPFACWQDSDDISTPRRLEIMLKHMEETKADVAMSYLNFFNGALSRKRWYPYKVDTAKYAIPDANGNPPNYGMNNNMTFATCFFRGDLKVFPFDETKIVAEDHAWFRSLLHAGKKFATFPEALYFARRHPGRITVLVREGKTPKRKYK